MLPIVAAAVAPIISELIQNGLGLIAGAIQAKGKQVIEQKLGVKIPDAGLTPELAEKLQEKQIEHEEFLINAQLEAAKVDNAADGAAQQEVTKRWQADMAGDSWLSKNVRPMTLLYWTVVISLLVTASPWLKVDAAWIDVVKYSYMAILSAYFVGRTVQHVNSRIQAAKEKKNDTP